MKIQTLLELIDTNVSKQRYRGDLKASEEGYSSKTPSGAYSKVVPDKTDPHMVKKYHHTPTKNEPDRDIDSFVYFALWLTKTKTYNICFPKIYNIKKIEDRNGEFIYKYQIEKLLSFKEIDVDNLQAVFKRYFDLEKAEDHFDMGLPWSHPKDAVRMVGSICEGYVNGHLDKDFFISSELIEALDSIRDFRTWMEENKREVMLDIANSGNIMFRRTGAGLQLVISDPVA